MTGIMEKMEKMEKIKFTKMQAFGNDYVYIDATKEIPEDLGGLAKRMCDRHFGIGSDGIVLLCSSERCDFRMRIFNPDGTEAEMCGNALRSVSKFAYFHGLTDKTRLTVETLGGDKTVDLRGRYKRIHRKAGTEGGSGAGQDGKGAIHRSASCCRGQDLQRVIAFLGQSSYGAPDRRRGAHRRGKIWTHGRKHGVFPGTNQCHVRSAGR